MTRLGIEHEFIGMSVRTDELDRMDGWMADSTHTHTVGSAAVSSHSSSSIAAKTMIRKARKRGKRRMANAFFLFLASLLIHFFPSRGTGEEPRLYPLIRRRNADAPRFACFSLLLSRSWLLHVLLVFSHTRSSVATLMGGNALIPPCRSQGIELRTETLLNSLATLNSKCMPAKLATPDQEGPAHSFTQRAYVLLYSCPSIIIEHERLVCDRTMPR